MFSLNSYTWSALSLSLTLTLFPILIRGEETVFDAARISRKLVDLSPDSVGTFATIFPSDHPDLPGQPFSLQQYYARYDQRRHLILPWCHPIDIITIYTPNRCHLNGSLTLLLLPISRHKRSRICQLLRLIVHRFYPPGRSEATGILNWFRGCLPRRRQHPDEDEITSCYLKRHPDAMHLLPKDKRQPHVAFWARFDPHAMYFVGGFGSSRYIGYIPLELYQTALQSESPHDPKSAAGRSLIDQT